VRNNVQHNGEVAKYVSCEKQTQVGLQVCEIAHVLVVTALSCFHISDVGESSGACRSSRHVCSCRPSAADPSVAERRHSTTQAQQCHCCVTRTAVFAERCLAVICIASYMYIHSIRRLTVCRPTRIYHSLIRSLLLYLH